MHTETTAPAATIDPRRRYLCRHIFTAGHRCGSPSLRGQDLCYYHTRTRREGPCAGRTGTFTLARIDDRPAVQIALYDVLSRLAGGDIDYKRGSILLYGLQIASSNLGRGKQSIADQPPQVEEIISDYDLGDLAPITEIPEPESAAPESAAPEPAAAAQTTHAAPAPSSAKTAAQPPVEEPNTMPAPHLATEMFDPTPSATATWDPSPSASPRTAAPPTTVILSEGDEHRISSALPQSQTNAPNTASTEAPNTASRYAKPSGLALSGEQNKGALAPGVCPSQEASPTPSAITAGLPTRDATGRLYPPAHKLDPPDTGRIPWPRTGKTPTTNPALTTPNTNPSPEELGRTQIHNPAPASSEPHNSALVAA
jgi:hypothetical protein